MKVYSAISQKGGAGKSTLVRQLSVVVGVAGPCLLVDRDPQMTTTRWFNRRQQLSPVPPHPDLLDIGTVTLTDAIGKLRKRDGTVFIDTRPAVTEPEAEAARVSDLVIVPVRPSPDDLEAVGETLKILKRLGKGAVLIVNAAKNEGRARDARAALSRYGVPVCPITVTDRAAYLDASLEGRGVGEMKGQGARDAFSELTQVWAWIQEIENGSEA